MRRSTDKEKRARSDNRVQTAKPQIAFVRRCVLRFGCALGSRIDVGYSSLCSCVIGILRNQHHTVPWHQYEILTTSVSKERSKCLSLTNTGASHPIHVMFGEAQHATRMIFNENWLKVKD